MGLAGGGTPTATNSAGAGNTPTAGSVKINGSNLGSALAGTIPATKLSANTTAGFSVVTFTGTQTAATVAHGLSQAPEMFILKNATNTSNSEWAVYSNQLPSANYYLALNTTAAQDQDTNRFNDTAPTSSVFSVGSGWTTNGTGNTMVVYCFHSVDGYSKVGKYSANGSADGPFIYTGFQPALVIIKAMDYNYEWVLFGDKMNPYNAVNKYLYVNNNNVETVDASGNFDIVSNGFKLRDASYNNNHPSGAGFLYYAVADIPFKTSNAR